VKKWVTLAFLCGAFFFYMTDRQLFGLLVPLICEDTGLNKVQIGLIDSALYWVLALTMPISGLAGDRFPRTRIIALAIVGWGALTVLTGFAAGLVGFLLIRAVAFTAVQTMYGPSAYALMADEHRTTRATAVSLHQAAMYTGMFTSGALVAVILAKFGSWRWVYYLFGAGTMLVGFAFAAAYWRDGARSVAARKSLLQGMKAFFGNPAALCAGLGYLALIFTANACMSWAPTFVAEKFHLDMGTVGKGVMFGPNVAAMVAVIGTGFVTDVFLRRYPRFRLVLQSAALLIGAPVMVLFGVSSSVGTCWIMLTGWGVVRGLFQANNFPSIFDVVPAESRASAVGFVNVFAYLVCSLAPLIFGFLSHRWGVRGFEVGFSALALLLVLAAGAEFVVSPDGDPEVIAETKRLGLASILGAMTPTEIKRCWSLGADIVKLFPADDLGYHYIQNLKGPLPHIPLMATGGVNPETIPEFLSRGILAVGTGITVFRPDLVAAEDYAGIGKLARSHMDAIENG